MQINAKPKSNKNYIKKKTFPPPSLKIKSYICPLLLGSSICFSVIYALYKNMAIPYTILFTVISYFLFCFFDRLKNRKKLGGVIYTLILLALTSISILLVNIGQIILGGETTFMLWFYGREEYGHVEYYFLNAVFIGGGFFVVSVLFYFTQIRYRTLGVMLCILFPFVLYSRHVAVMPQLMTTVIVMLFLAVVVHNRRIDPTLPNYQRTIFKMDRSYLTSILVFVTVTGTVTMAIEKPIYISKLEQNAGLFDYAFRGGGSGSDSDGGSLEQTTKTSSQRYGARNYTGDPLFYFVTGGSSPVYYLRKQPYTTFNGDVWEVSDNFYKKPFFYTSVFPEYTNYDIINDTKTVFEGYGRKFDYNSEYLLPVKSGQIYSDTFKPRYLPAPFGTITDTEKSVKVRYKKDKQGIIYRTRSFGNGSKLEESFYFFEHTNELYTYAAELGLSSDEYVTMLSESDNTKAILLLDDYEAAKKDYTDTNTISEKTARLAAEITNGLHSDFEKAAALEQYFEINGYIYDENYNPDDQSIDYFIFEGKTGVCSSYATAMTLMARSVGLPARYVEGFAAFEKSDNGTFIIRDKHAHAFVEVYIPGAGWMTFDPTVSGYMSVENDGGNNLISITLNFLYRFIIVVIVAVYIIVMWLRDRIMECIFRIMQLFRDPREKTLKLYANIIKVINFSADEDYSSYTVRMLGDYINTTRGNAPQKIMMLFERTAFGGYEPSAEEYHEAYLEYKKCYKYLRKIPLKKNLK